MKKYIFPILGFLIISSLTFNILQREKLSSLNDELSKVKLTLETIRKNQEYKKNEEAYVSERTLYAYIKKEISESEIIAFKNLIGKQDFVRFTLYLSPDKSLGAFINQRKHDLSTLQELSNLDENMLSAQLIIAVEDPSHVDSLIDFIHENDQNKIIDSLQRQP